MIRFSLFGVPVSIHPSLWLTLAVLGGMLGADSWIHALSVCLFVIAGFFCLICHEMGHALVGRYFGGGEPRIYLAWLGGDCNNPRARMKRWQGVVMTAAGPGASLALGVLAAAALCLYVGDVAGGLSLAGNFMFGIMPPGAEQYGALLALFFFLYLIEVSFWWSMLNLIPVFPLDGGQILNGLLRSPRQVHSISMGVACLLVLFFAVLGVWLMAILMALMAVMNGYSRSQAPY